MNLYILVEGRTTEKKVYPAWLNILIPDFKQSKSFFTLNSEHNFYIFSSEGYPSYLDDLCNAIEDINNNPIYDYLLFCIDSDNFLIEEKKNEVLNYIQAKYLTLNTKCKLIIIIQNPCIETWFLGNRKIITRNPTSTKLIEYTKHYDLIHNDPEEMPNYFGFNSISQFHLSYLEEIFKEKYNHFTYKKNHPGDVSKEFYLNEIIKKTQDKKSQLKSFQNFLSIIEEIKISILTIGEHHAT